MKTSGRLLALLVTATVLGCGNRQSRNCVIVPDLSASIGPDALRQEFRAIDQLVGRLQRGDRIAVIPILGDAETEASGRILRFEIPTARQAYDSDLRNFRNKLQAELKEMQSNALAHPGTKSDILGSVVLTQEELQASPSRSKQMLVILSDFIQEGQGFDFRTDKRLRNMPLARRFANECVAKNKLSLSRVSVYLGLLRSSEYSALQEARRNTIKEFWIQYFRDADADPRFGTDGPGLLRFQVH